MSTSNSRSSRPLKPATPARRAVRWRHWLRQALWTLLFLLLSFGGTVLVVGTLGRSVYRWHGFAVELRLLPATRGETALVLMPLGEVQAHTHRAPVALIATLQEIEIEEINKVLNNNPGLDALTKDFEVVARQDLRSFIIRQLVLGALGAMLAPLLLRSRKLWKYAASAVFGFALIGTALGSALLTFNGKAFESPTYTGALRQAPWVIQFGKDAFVRFDELSQKLRTVAANLNVLYGRISVPPDRLDSVSEADIVRILHVSDLHNNPAGITFMQEVARQFHVSLIVDTGDLTDFGSPPETAIVQGIGKIGYPYVFVAGNHDSQTVIKALSQLSNVTVLDGQIATVEGLTFLGLPNPASSRASVGNVDTTADELQVGGEALLRTVERLHEPPDVLAVHNPEETRPLWGHTPLVLCGHLHRYYLEIEKGGNPTPLPPRIGPSSSPPSTTALRAQYETVVCNAGTTGAAGLRYFEKEQGVSFSCAVLTFRRATVKAAASPRPAAPSPGAAPEYTSAPAVPPQAPPPTGAAGTPGSSTTVMVQRPRLMSADLIVLDGALHQYSITHTPLSESLPPARIAH